MPLSYSVPLSQSSTALPHPHSPRLLSPQSWRVSHPASSSQKLSEGSARHHHQQPQRSHSAQHSITALRSNSQYQSNSRYTPMYSEGSQSVSSSQAVYTARSRSAEHLAPQQPMEQIVTPESTRDGALVRASSTSPTRGVAGSVLGSTPAVARPWKGKVEVADVYPSYTITGAPVRCMAVVEEEQIVWTAEYDGRIRIRLIPSGRVVRQIDGRDDTYVTSLQYVAATRHMWVSFHDGYMYVYRVMTRRDGEYGSSRRSNRGSPPTATAAADDADSGVNEITMDKLNDSMSCVDGALNGAPKASFTYTPELVTMFVQHSGPVHCMLALGNSVFSGGADWKVLKWDAAHPGSRSRLLPGHAGGVRCMCSYDGPTGAVLFTGSDDATIRAWNPYLDYLVQGTNKDHNSTNDGGSSSSNTIIANPHANSSGIHTLNKENAQLSQGRSSIVTSNKSNHVNQGASSHVDEQNRIDDPQEACLFTFVGHHRSVLALAVVASMNQLWSGGEDTSVRMWDLTTLRCRWSETRVHRAPVSVLLHLGSRLWSGDKHGDIVVWDVRRQTALQRVSDKMRVGPMHGMVLALQPVQRCSMWRVWSSASTGVMQSWNVDVTPMSGEGWDWQGGAMPTTRTPMSWSKMGAPSASSLASAGQQSRRAAARANSPQTVVYHSESSKTKKDDSPVNDAAGEPDDDESDTVDEVREEDGRHRLGGRREREALRSHVRTLEARIRVLRAKQSAAAARARRRRSAVGDSVSGSSDICVSPVTVPPTPMNMPGQTTSSDTYNDNSSHRSSTGTNVHDHVRNRSREDDEGGSWYDERNGYAMIHTHHSITLEGAHWVSVLQCKPNELYDVLVDEVTTACGVPACRLSHIHVRTNWATADRGSLDSNQCSRGRSDREPPVWLYVEFDVQHLTAVDVEANLQRCNFAAMYALHDTVHSRPATGLDAAHNALRAIHDELRHVARSTTSRRTHSPESNRFQDSHDARRSSKNNNNNNNNISNGTSNFDSSSRGHATSSSQLTACNAQYVEWDRSLAWPAQADAETARLRQESERLLQNITNEAEHARTRAGTSPSPSPSHVEREWEQRLQEQSKRHATELQQRQEQLTHEQAQQRRQQEEEQHHRLQLVQAELAAVRQECDALRGHGVEQTTHIHTRLEPLIVQLTRQGCAKDEEIRRLTLENDKLRVRVTVLTEDGENTPPSLQTAKEHVPPASPATRVGTATADSARPTNLCPRDVGDIIRDADTALADVVRSGERRRGASLPRPRHGDLARKVKVLEDIILAAGSRVIHADSVRTAATVP